MMRSVGIASAVTTGLIVWEHVARKHDVLIRPSKGLIYVGDKSQAFFTGVGYLCARISSFYTYIDLSDFGQTLQDLFGPLGRLLISPSYIFRGYLDTMSKYKYPILIVIGSLTLIGGLIFLKKKYPNFNYYELLTNFRSVRQS